jgi:hydrogenase 3 maturation protease
MPDDLTFLLGNKEKRILFVGIGNVLKNDDGVGVYISESIKEHDNIRTLTAGPSLENYIGKINSLQPDILVLVDCAELKIKPGQFRIMDIGNIQDHTFNTHNISLKRLAEFFPMQVFLLGIQPENIGFGENISYFVKCKADLIINKINKKEVHHGS